MLTLEPPPPTAMRRRGSTQLLDVWRKGAPAGSTSARPVLTAAAPLVPIPVPADWPDAATDERFWLESLRRFGAKPCPPQLLIGGGFGA